MRDEVGETDSIIKASKREPKNIQRTSTSAPPSSSTSSSSAPLALASVPAKEIRFLVNYKGVFMPIPLYTHLTVDEAIQVICKSHTNLSKKSAVEVRYSSARFLTLLTPLTSPRTGSVRVVRTVSDRNLVGGWCQVEQV